MPWVTQLGMWINKESPFFWKKSSPCVSPDDPDATGGEKENYDENQI